MAAAFFVSPSTNGIAPLKNRIAFEELRQLEIARVRQVTGGLLVTSFGRFPSSINPIRDIALRLRLQRDQLPEEILRTLEEGDRRIKELEEEYWKSLDAKELAIERKCASGLAHLKMNLLDHAAEDYLAAAELRWGMIRGSATACVAINMIKWHGSLVSCLTRLRLCCTSVMITLTTNA